MEKKTVYKLYIHRYLESQINEIVPMTWWSKIFSFGGGRAISMKSVDTNIQGKNVRTPDFGGGWFRDPLKLIL